MTDRFLALGDSLTAGYGVGLSRSFATLYYQNLSLGYPELRYVNLGMNGLTSGHLVSMLGHSKLRSILPEARIITITVGSNDLLSIGKGMINGERVDPDYVLRDFWQNMFLLGESIRRINASTTIKVATIYNPLPPLDKPLKTFVHTLLKSANQCISHMAREYGGVVIPVAKAFQGKEQVLLGPDRFHPSVAGHKVMAELFARY